MKEITRSSKSSTDAGQVIEKELDEYIASLERFFLHAPIGVGLVTQDRILKFLNDKMCQMVEYSRDELINKSAKVLYKSEAEFHRVGELFQALEARDTGTIETSLQKKNGELIEVLVSAWPVNPNDLSAGFTVTATGISDRKRVQKALRSSEQQYRMLVEQASDGIFISDQQGRYLDVNSNGYRMLGYTREEILNLTITDLILERDRFENPLRVNELLSGRTLITERQMVRKDGSILSAEVSAKMLPDGRLQAIVRDITQRKKAEKALRDSEERYRLLVKSLPNSAVMLFDHNHRYLLADGEEIEKGGFDKAKIEGQTLAESFPPDLVDLFKPLYDKALRGQATYFEHRYRGSHYYQQILPVYDNQDEIYAGMVVSHNITKRKSAEEALKESEAKLRSILRSAPIGIGLVRDRVINWTNERLHQMTGYSAKELWGQRARILYPTDEEFEYVGQEKYRQIEASGKGTVETRWQRKDGRIIDVLLSSSSIDPNFLSVGVTFCALDITKRKQAEETLRQYTDRLQILHEIDRAILELRSPKEVAASVLEHLRKLLPCNLLGIFTISSEGQTAKVLAVYPENKSTIQADSQVLLSDFGHTIDLLHSGQEQVIRDASQLSQPTPLEQRLIGEEIRSLINIPLIIRDNLIGLVKVGAEEKNVYQQEQIEIAREVADQLAIAIQQSRLYQQVQQHAEELEQRVAKRTAQLEAANQELTEFAYIVSHDLKAPLRGINQLAEWISTDYADVLNEEGHRLLQLLKGRVLRMHNLIEGVLQYSRAGRLPNQQKVIDLNQLVQHIIDGLALPAQIEIRVEDSLPTIQGDQTRLEQLFQNLLSNAIKFIDKPTGQISIAWVDEGSCWRFSVADNGPGIPATYHLKIFQVFQTLSPRDKIEGSGIGLAIVKKIVESWGGRIWLESTVGQGTTFYFTLPKETESRNHSVTY